GFSDPWRRPKATPRPLRPPLEISLPERATAIPPGGRSAKKNFLEPALEVVDPHHHLWDRDEHRYLLDQLLADTGSGHNVSHSIFVECGSMYRAEGPAEMKPVGEIEFVNGAAAMSASGRYGKSRLCAGIVGHADLRLGDGVARVLEAQIAAGDGRFRGIRHSVVWDESPTFSRGRTNSPKGQMVDATWRAGFARLAPLNLSFEAWLYHPQLLELAELARAFPQTTIILNHVGGPLGIGPYANKKEETFAQWKTGIAELGKCQNVSSSSAGSACCSACLISTRVRRLRLRRSWRVPISPTSTIASRRSAQIAECSRATSRRTASARATLCCGMPSSVSLAIFRWTRRQSCSAVRPSAFT